MAIPAFLSNISAPSTTYAGRGIFQAGRRRVHCGGRRCRVERYGLRKGKRSRRTPPALRLAWRHRVERQGHRRRGGLQAIAYVRGKKLSKMQRKAVIGTTKFGLQVAATVGLATVGSVYESPEQRSAPQGGSLREGRLASA